ncbi:MAG: hypothetical protein QOI04_521 [Verrucomicrobiota bacterium]|jgi:hypothetical protein
MRFRHCKNWIAFASIIVVALCCSCEKHQPGELGDDTAKSAAHETEASAPGEKAAASATPTPAEFFPGNKP